MEAGSSSDKRQSSSVRVEPFVPKSDHNPRELRSWAKRTGFVSDYSSEAGTSTTTATSGNYDSARFNLEHKNNNGGGSSPKIEIDPILGRTRRDRRNEIELENGGAATIRKENENERGFNLVGINENQNQKKVVFKENGNKESNGHGISAVAPVPEAKNDQEEAIMTETDVKVNVYVDGDEPGEGGCQRPPGLKCGLSENPGFGTNYNLLRNFFFVFFLHKLHLVQTCM